MRFRTGWNTGYFEKHVRDVHVITQHAYANAMRLASVGQSRPGLEPGWPFFAL